MEREPREAPPDPFKLHRFVEAQDRVYSSVLEELASGRKQSHWMWFVFPQIAGLGTSPTARRFAISSVGEASVYLDHPILGARLRECTELVCGIEGRTAEEIFGTPDWMKFRSSMTLFSAAKDDNRAPFDRALEKYFHAEPDSMTLRLLSQS